ncbi:CLUMA_CG008568, isoform A [Clunio marinus]|uniref:CLUMA_CG008568, isoform A n=1 Tax=Clunio marinus TaxID=568069 RepID=A0A1J1I5R9_9DIPT|nr:CLUMA_CG008568, isoform A [Clunio marinus]
MMQIRDLGQGFRGYHLEAANLSIDYIFTIQHLILECVNFMTLIENLLETYVSILQTYTSAQYNIGFNFNRFSGGENIKGMKFMSEIEWKLSSCCIQHVEIYATT